MVTNMADINDMVIEYIIEQADRYDIHNLQFEQDILFTVRHEKDWLHTRIMNAVNDDIDTVLQIQQLIDIITRYYRTFSSKFKGFMLDKFEDYYDISYTQTGELIQLGREVYGNMSSKVSEMEYGKEYVEFIRDHSFELLTGFTQAKINTMRSTLSNLMLSGRSDKANVRDAIQKILNTNESKAEEIAQTELSRAYNYGTMARLYDYQKQSGEKVRKYWYGFKYSKSTCEDCRPHIGEIYDLDDESFSLPLHVRCRCVWLPVLAGWDKPISGDLISRANMINTAYSKDMIYNRINSRLGINYGEYIDEKSAINYMAGDRTEITMSALKYARSGYIDDIIKKFDIIMDTANTHMSTEFNTQMKFWQNYVGGAIADGDKDLVNRSYEAIKAVTILPWNESQMSKWNSLLNSINLYR